LTRHATHSFGLRPERIRTDSFLRGQNEKVIAGFTRQSSANRRPQRLERSRGPSFAARSDQAAAPDEVSEVVIAHCMACLRAEKILESLDREKFTWTRFKLACELERMLIQHKQKDEQNP